MFEHVKKILVIKLRHIGDVLLSTPVFRTLRESFPDASVSVLVNKGTEEVLQGNPLIDEVIVFDRSIKSMGILKRFLKEVLFLNSLRKRGFDMTVDLTGGDRAAIVSLASGAKYRLGRKSKKGFIGKQYIYTHLSEPNGRKHMILQNLDVMVSFGIRTEHLSVDFFISEEDRKFIKSILNKSGVCEKANIIHIHPTSRWLFKCWKDEYMAEIVRWLLDKGNTVVVTSSPDRLEMEKARRILSLVRNGPDLGLIELCGRTTIKQLGALSEVSDLFFGVDSAPMHIAAAVGTPVVALFGPSGAFNWGPWDNERGIKDVPYFFKNGVQTFGIHTVIQMDWNCIPCGEDGCEGSKISKCLYNITPEDVKAVLDQKLKEIVK